jgi:hypothetical protein
MPASLPLPAPGALFRCPWTRNAATRPWGPFLMPTDPTQWALSRCPQMRVPPLPAPGHFPDARGCASMLPPAPGALSRFPRTCVNAAARPWGPFPMPADARPHCCPPMGPFPMPADARPRLRGPFPMPPDAHPRHRLPPGPFPNASPFPMPAEAPPRCRCMSLPMPTPRALSRCLRAGGSGDASGRLWRAIHLRAALACIGQPPSASGWPSASGRLWRASRRTAVHGPATAVRLWAALGCVRTPGNCRPPSGGLGLRPDAARQLCLRAAWAFGRMPNLPGGGWWLPDAHRPFNLPSLETFADMITINRKFELPTQK